MATPTYPGVYIQELTSPVHPITGVATSIAAFVGYTATGIDNRAEEIFSPSDFQRLFGGLASNSEVSYAVQQFFANGGSQAYVVRTPATSMGASAASVVFDQMTFTALSSGSWANGQLLIDVDFSGLAQPVSGSITTPGGISTEVDGTGTSFTSVLKVNQYLVFAADPTQTPFQIATITSAGVLHLASPPPAMANTTAIMIADPTAFNLTITNLNDNTVEYFPNVSLNNNLNNYIENVVNDLDNGSQLVNVQVTSPGPAAPTPVITGLVAATTVAGAAVNIASIDTALAGSTAVVGGVNVTNNSATVTGAGFTATRVGQLLVFASDSTQTLYQVASVASGGASLVLTAKFTGATSATTATQVKTTASTDWSIELGVSSPSTPPPPLPISIKVFAKNTPLPQTFTGLAAQLQRAINSALAVQMPGASVVCTVSGIGVTQAIRVSAMIPQVPDAVLTITPPPAGMSDAATPLGFATPGTSNVAHYSLGTGNNGWGSQTTSTTGADGTGLPATADLIGDPGLFTGIYALNQPDIFFNLLCIPEATRAVPGSPSTLDSTVDPNSVYSAAIALCDSKRAMLLLDCPPYVNSVPSAVDWKTSGLTVVDPNGAAFFPRLRLPDPLNSYQLRTFAPCGLVAGLYARIDTTRGVWKAPAGTEATLSGVQALVYKLSDLEQGALNPLGLNCFRNFPVYGSVLWGARTLVGADAETNQWKYVPVRRVALFLESSLYQGTQWVVFEPNDEPLWSAIRLNVGSFMQNLFVQGFFQGQTPDQAYFVKCDSDTTTQTDIDNGIVNIVVGFAPLIPAEFVIIKIQQLSGQTTS